jgi:hypothetical protein
MMLESFSIQQQLFSWIRLDCRVSQNLVKHDNLLWSQLTNLSPPNAHFKCTIVNCNEKNRGTGMFPSHQ